MLTTSDPIMAPAWGAIPLADGRWRFRLWTGDAPAPRLRLAGRTLDMAEAGGGWREVVAKAASGDAYGFELDGALHADPASRRQQGAVDGASLLVDTAALSPDDWPGRAWHETVILELHLGTFTREGTLRAATAELPRLAALGITALEVMPVAHFQGMRGWGYDGALPYACHPAYGTPEDLAAFVAAAHAAGLSVFLDVVYNHFGPVGNVLSRLSPDFFDAGRDTPWGSAIAIDRAPVRAFFVDNAAMWLRDFGIDGLRLDAVHQIGAPGDTAFLADLAAHLHGLDLGRPIHLYTEDERNLVHYAGPGLPYRAQWNDDYHHAIHCTLTGEAQSYYAPYAIDPFGDLVLALREGQIDQGQHRPGSLGPRGASSGHLPPTAFINANQTHDQIGNRALGERLLSLADPGAARVCHALLLLAPFVPMLFMGEEEGARAPFLFFADYDDPLAEAVRRGRRSEFPEFADHPGDIPDPVAEETFAASRPYASPAPDAEAWRDLTCRALAARHGSVMPLLASGWLGTEVSRLADRALHAVWRFEAGRLVLRLSLGTHAPAPAGRDGLSEVFALGDPAADAFAIWVGTDRKEPAGQYA